jgi:hypothetical protein
VSAILEILTVFFVQGEKQMCETLLRGVYKRIFFNPGLFQTENEPRGNCLP